MQRGVAEKFLTAFAVAAEGGAALEAIAADVGGFTAALAEQPAAFGAAIVAAARQAGGVAQVDEASFASAACTPTGRIIIADPRFASLEIEPIDLARAVTATGAGESRLSAIANDSAGRSVALAFARLPRAAAWPLPPAVRDAVAAAPGNVAVLGVRPGNHIADRQLFEAWTLTPGERRITAALIGMGDLRHAAARVGISYETAREAIASAISKTGTRRQSELVRSLTLLALGELPAHDATWRTFADAYQLSERQAQFAQLVAMGATRGGAATVLGVSAHVAKADLKRVYERCRIDGAAALARLVAEVDALARLALAADVEIVARGGTPEPLRFVRRRRAPGRIAVQDHGPASGVPTIYFHTPTTGRHMPRTLVAALQARGLRPISLERPGFGLTSPASGRVVDDAVDDLADVLDALGLTGVNLLGRSCVMPLAFAAAHPGLVNQGLLLSTVPPGMRANRGLFGKVGDLALDTPGLVEAFARVLVGYSSDRAIVHFAERGLSGCPADLAAFADAANRTDYIRATRQLSTSAGLARELTLHADGCPVPDAARGIDWTVLIGGRDALVADAEAGRAAWTAALPGAKVVIVPDGGRFLHMSHAALCAGLLAGG